ATFFEEMGISPRQFIDVKALMGDTSDGYPGVRGIGEKTAIKLGLEEALKKQATLIRLYSDSKVAIEAIHKRHAKNPLFKP
ncbi:5'-3' exonuclease H3TH domain-containing protein, partial [Listeria monocytogenes]|uniref:5'-3' exonuclease H3TH domain-containing protein n=1 Tax=Listeria monocytogenes TaxID=1639 RepID=UPI00247683B5